VNKHPFKNPNPNRLNKLPKLIVLRLKSKARLLPNNGSISKLKLINFFQPVSSLWDLRSVTYESVFRYYGISP
jgi:hypothetical protein